VTTTYRCGLEGLSHCFLFFLFIAGIILLLPGCASKTVTVPGPAVEVKVPVPVACKIEQVPQTTPPSAQARKGMSIFDLSKIALADRRAKMAEIERLRAAANNPCPAR
jgi:hypothetical protein